MNHQTSKWIDWAREIFTLSQSGLTYSGNQYDIERYKRLQEITAEIIASQSDIAKESVLASFSMQAGYITPKVDVRGAVVREPHAVDQRLGKQHADIQRPDRVLLARGGGHGRLEPVPLPAQVEPELATRRRPGRTPGPPPGLRRFQRRSRRCAHPD